MLRLTQAMLRSFLPTVNGFVSKLIYCGKNVKIGRNFSADGIPRILIDEKANLSIGSNVELRSGVEIRVHGNAQVRIGNGVRIDRGVRILAANMASVVIDDGARVGLYSVLNGGDSIYVGKKALISGFVYLQTSMHKTAGREQYIQDQGYAHKPVFISSDAWLGAHVVILPGVTIGQGAVVGSNAVVTRSIDGSAVVAGVPARIINTREV